tara:strand:+ start:137483 stop:138124 length:642 start_codon:yes stop_codon:yes gene_type:complete
MKTNINIQLEGEEALEVIRALLGNPSKSVKVEVLPDDTQTTESRKMTEEPDNTRHCTRCGVKLESSVNIKTGRFIRREFVCNGCYSGSRKGKKVNRTGSNHCRKCGVELTTDNWQSKRSYICTSCKVKKSDDHVTITAEQRTQWARERREIIGGKITQVGTFQGALIVEHIRGTHYKIQLPSGAVIDAKHKKQKTLGGDELGAGWSKWEKRSG